MGAKIGHKKVGGRKKGTVNKKTQTLMDKAAKLGVDPFEILLHFAQGNWEELGYESGRKEISVGNGVTVFVDTIQVEDRIQAAKEVCQYIHPKRKAVEVINEVKEEPMLIIYKTEWGSSHETLEDDSDPTT